LRFNRNNIIIAPNDSALRGGPLVKNRVFGDSSVQVRISRKDWDEEKKRKRRRRKLFRAIFPSSRHGLIYVAR